MASGSPTAADHRVWSRRAVDHSLGGLSATEDREFRQHLLACTQCRQHVAELHLLTNQLESVARSERSRIQTIVSELEPSSIDPSAELAAIERAERTRRRTARLLRWLAAVGIAGAIAGLVSTYALRTELNERTAEFDEQARFLDDLSTATPVIFDAPAGVDGTIGLLPGELLVNLSGLPTPGDDHALTVWFLAGDGLSAQPPIVYAVEQLPTGHVALRTPSQGVARVVITIEPTIEGAVSGGPSAQPLFEATISR